MPQASHPCPDCGVATRGARCRRCAEISGSTAPRIERTCRTCGQTFTGVAQQKTCPACRQAAKQAWARRAYREYPQHREANKTRSRERHQRLRDEINPKLREHARRRHLTRKLTALAHYGSSCACCGERDYRFLTLDHSNHDGAEHRKAIGSRGGGAPFLISLERLGWPAVPGLRTLCANCHMAIDLWDGCPHRERRLSERFGLSHDLARAILAGQAGDTDLEAIR